MRKLFVIMVLAMSIGAPALAQQRITTEMLRGEWLGKIEGFPRGDDNGERGFRFWALLGTDGVGPVHLVVNGKPDTANLIRLTATGDSVAVPFLRGTSIDAKLTTPDELSGTWKGSDGTTQKIRLQRSKAPAAVNRDYRGQVMSPGTNTCVSLDVLAKVKDGHMTGTIGYSYLSFGITFDLVGEVWSNGEVDYMLNRVGGGFAGYHRGKIENGRFRSKLNIFTNCGVYDIDVG